MKLKLWQKWILGGGSIAVLGSAGLLSLFIYSKQDVSQGYENKSGLPINNDLSQFKEISTYQMELLDPISLQKVSEYKYAKDSNGQIDGIDAKKWVDDYLVKNGGSPILSVYAGPINFINEYTEVFLPKDFIEYIHWYSQYVSWSPDLSSISTFRIKKGIERENNSITLGSFTAEESENKIIKFIPDSFFQDLDVSSFIRRLTRENTYGLTLEETGLTKDEIKTYVKEINKLNKIKKEAGKEDEILHLYSFEEVKSGSLSVTKEVGAEDHKTLEKLYVPTFLPGGKKMKDSFDKNLTRFAREVSDIFPQLDDNGDIMVVNGVKKALHTADKITYLELQRAVALENWKGIDANFLKYVTTHEYGHMLTLGSINDGSVGATSIGFPDRQVGAAASGQAVDIDNLNLYLAARVPNIRAKLAKPHTKKDANGVEQWILYEDDLAKWEAKGKKGPKPNVFSYLNVMFEYTANTSQSQINWQDVRLDHIFPGNVDTLSNDSPIDLTSGIADVRKAIDFPDDQNVKKFLFLTRDINDLRSFSKSLNIPLEASWVMVNFDNFIQTLLPSLRSGKDGVPLAEGINERGEWESAFTKSFNLRNDLGQRFFREANANDANDIKNKRDALTAFVAAEKTKPNPDILQIAKWNNMIEIYGDYWSFVKHPVTGNQLFVNLNALANQLKKKEEDLTKKEFDEFKTFYLSFLGFGLKSETGNESTQTGFDTKTASASRNISTANEFSRKLINEILNDPTRQSGSVQYKGSDIYRNLTLNNYEDVTNAWASRNTYGIDDNASLADKADGNEYKRKLAFTSIGGKRYFGIHSNLWNGYLWIAMPSLFRLNYMNRFTPKIYNYWENGDALFNIYDVNGVQLKTAINIADFNNIPIAEYQKEYQAQTPILNLPPPDPKWNTSMKYALALRDAMGKKAVQFKININAASREDNNTDPTNSYLKGIDETKLKTISFNELLSIIMPKFSDLTFDTNATFTLNNKTFQNEISLQTSKISTLINNPSIDETKALGAQLYSIIYDDPYFGFEDDQMNEDKFWELVTKLRDLTEAQIRRGETQRNFQKALLQQFKILVFDGKDMIKTTEKEVKEWYRIHISGTYLKNAVTFDKKPFILKTMAMLASLSVQESESEFKDSIYSAKDENMFLFSGQTTRQVAEFPSIWKWLQNPKGTKNASSVRDIRTTYLYSLPEILTRDYVMATMPIVSLDQDEFRYGSKFGSIKVGTGGYNLYLDPKKYMSDSQDEVYNFILKSDEYQAKMFDSKNSVLANARKAMSKEMQEVLLEISPLFVSNFNLAINTSIGLIRTTESGYQHDRWLRSAINDGKTNGKNFQIYDDKGEPVKDINIRIKGLDGKELNDAKKDRAYAFWLYLLKSFGVGDRTISNIWREPKRDGLSMWGYISKNYADQIKYLKATKENGDVKYFPIRQNIDNLFYLKKQGMIESKHTLADDGFVSWTTEKFLISGKWTNADLTIGTWHLEFVNDNKQPVLDSVTGKNVFTIGSRDRITENNKPFEYAPIVLTEDEKGDTIATIKNQFGGLE